MAGPRRLMKKPRKRLSWRALLDGISAGTTPKHKKKALAKAKEAAKEALAKAQEIKPETKDAEEAPEVTDDSMKAGFQADLEKAKQAQETAKGTMTAAANLMFMFYSNLLSPESKYAWNKIVIEQTEWDPYVNLQGVSLEGPREMSCKLLNNCIMFFSLRFPSMQLSKKSTTSRMYLRSPSTSMCVSSYVV
jgi:hypothetical protein